MSDGDPLNRATPGREPLGRDKADHDRAAPDRATPGSATPGSAAPGLEAKRPRRRLRFHRPAAPTVLDPILRLWEQADRRRRRIRPIRTNGVLGLEFGRHNGPPVELSDGTLIQRGDPIGTLHLENARVQGIATSDWQVRGLREARADLRVLAGWAARQPPDVRPRAYTGETLMGPFARRVGLEVRPRPRTARSRLDEWFLRWLIARWSPGGRERLQHGRGAMRSSDVWLSDAALQRRYGGAAANEEGPTPSDG